MMGIVLIAMCGSAYLSSHRYFGRHSNFFKTKKPMTWAAPRALEYISDKIRSAKGRFSKSIKSAFQWSNSFPE